jgi:hypothetical protein
LTDATYEITLADAKCASADQAEPRNESIESRLIEAASAISPEGLRRCGFQQRRRASRAAPGSS